MSASAMRIARVCQRFRFSRPTWVVGPVIDLPGQIDELPQVARRRDRYDVHSHRINVEDERATRVNPDASTTPRASEEANVILGGRDERQRDENRARLSALQILAAYLVVALVPAVAGAVRGNGVVIPAVHAAGLAAVV